MSAFIIDDEQMHIVVAAVLKNETVFNGIKTAQRTAGTRIGKALFALNYSAVNYLYNENEKPHAYKFDASYLEDNSSRYRAAAAVSSLLYQCSEKDEDMQGALFQALNALDDKLSA